MCMFAGDVEDVSNTKIFVGHDGNSSQLTVYQMEVTLDYGAPTNAMILPVPAPASTIDLHDLSKFPDFFKKLDDVFPNERSRGMALGKGFGIGAAGTPLEVHKVGDYDVSIAPSADDLSRLNEGVFTVSRVLKHVMKKKYEGFAFVVCRISPQRFRGGGSIHPLAYTHTQSRHPDLLFVPTRHVHGGDVTDYLQSLKAGAPKPKWDHAIYFQGPRAQFVTSPGNGTHKHARSPVPDKWKAFKEGMSEELWPYFIFQKGMHKHGLHGRLDNIDLMVNV